MNRVTGRKWSGIAGDETGQDLVEYALLLAFLALIVIAALRLIGTTVSTVFEEMANTLNNAA